MKLHILKADEIVFKGDVTQIKASTAEGDFEILDEHAPLIAILNKGNLHYEEIKENVCYKFDLKINSGILKIDSNSAVVLAE